MCAFCNEVHHCSSGVRMAEIAQSMLTVTFGTGGAAGLRLFRVHDRLFGRYVGGGHRGDAQHRRRLLAIVAGWGVDMVINGTIVFV